VEASGAKRKFAFGADRVARAARRQDLTPTARLLSKACLELEPPTQAGRLGTA
jgi:hypothetical protein